MFGSEGMTVFKRKTGWTPTMTGHSEQGGQIKCLTSSEGWEYMPDYDSLPAAVRQRLAKSPFNICAACLDIEVREQTRRPTAAAYLAAIAQIERKLR
jgi:hypothetical protein